MGEITAPPIKVEDNFRKVRFFIFSYGFALIYMFRLIIQRFATDIYL